MMHDLALATVPLDDLTPYKGNARRGDLDMVRHSLDVNGQYRPIVVNRGTFTGIPNQVLAGNHTLAAARSLGWEQIAVTFVDVDEETARRIVLVDNKSNDAATYDNEALLELLQSLDDLDGTGYGDEDLDELIAAIEAAEHDGDGPGEGDEDDDAEPDHGSLLALADIGWAEPRHEVKTGEHWRLGHHHLIVCDVHREWELWAPHLVEGMIFAPYPNVYLVGSENAELQPYLFVQPRPLLAAHMLDKFESLFPGQKIERVK